MIATRNLLSAIIIALLVNPLTDVSATSESPEITLKRLIEGNHRFARNLPPTPSLDQFSRKELIAHPQIDAIVVSASDSRVPPELIFDQPPGKLLVARSAGTVIGSSAVATIEQATQTLKARLLIIMGHNFCDITRKALITPEDQSAGSPDLDTLLASIRPHLSGYEKLEMLRDRSIERAVRLNVDGQTQRLLERSHIVRRAVQSGQLKIVRALYKLDSGRVIFWDSKGPIP